MIDLECAEYILSLECLMQAKELAKIAKPIREKREKDRKAEDLREERFYIPEVQSFLKENENELKKLARKGEMSATLYLRTSDSNLVDYVDKAYKKKGFRVRIMCTYSPGMFADGDSSYNIKLNW